MKIENKILTEKDIKSVIDELIQYYNISDYVKDVKFPNNIQLYGYYNITDQIININSNLIITDSIRKNRINIMNISKKDYLKINLDILFHIFHEIEHVNQIKYINDNPDNIIRQTLILGFDEQLLSKLSNSDKYVKHHDIYTHEYNANVAAAMKINDFIMNEEANNYSKKVLFKQFCYGYYLRPDGLTCPLKEYLKTINKDKDILVPTDISEYGQVVYGLPIDETTFQKIKSLESTQVNTYKEYFNR